MNVTISDLADLTGLTRQVVAKKLRGLEHGTGKYGAKLYESAQVLPILYEIDNLDRSVDLNQARARLAEKQMEKIDFELDLKRGGFIPFNEILEAGSRIFTSFRTRLLSIPTKGAPRIAGIDDPIEVQEIFEEYLLEALNELEDLREFIERYRPADEGVGQEIDPSETADGS